MQFDEAYKGSKRKNMRNPKLKKLPGHGTTGKTAIPSVKDRDTNSVIAWVKATFPKYHKQMKGVDWGTLYKAFGDCDLDPDALEAEAKALFQDDDVTNKSGIYPYLLYGGERHLNIRAFTEASRTFEAGTSADCPHGGV